jgi:hypothetical protein
MRQLVDGAPPGRVFRACATRTIGIERAPGVAMKQRVVLRAERSLSTLSVTPQSAGSRQRSLRGEDPCRRRTHMPDPSLHDNGDKVGSNKQPI